MKSKLIFPSALAASALLVSCASDGGGEDYDVSNPYAAPDYVDDSGSPYQPSDVNPAYDAPAAYDDATIAPEPAAPSRPAPQPAMTKVHTVVSGDSLWKISRKYGVSVDAIKRANGLTTDVAVLGAKLQIPSS